MICPLSTGSGSNMFSIVFLWVRAWGRGIVVLWAMCAGDSDLIPNVHDFGSGGGKNLIMHFWMKI